MKQSTKRMSKDKTVFVVAKQWPVDEIIDVVDTIKTARKLCNKLPPEACGVYYSCKEGELEGQAGYEKYMISKGEQ